MNNLAQTGVTEPKGGIYNPALGENLKNMSGTSFVQKLVSGIVSFIFIIGTLVFFFVLITGAIKWISSGGDKQKVEEARGTITSAIIGLVILFATFAIIKLIETFFGISILTLDIGSLVIQ